MPESITISLAGTAYTVPRLTLRQLRDLHVGVVKTVTPADAAERVSSAYTSDLDIIVTALRRNYPDLTAEAILDSEATKAETDAAALAILRFSGLVPPEGEAVAPAPTAE